MRWDVDALVCMGTALKVRLAQRAPAPALHVLSFNNNFGSNGSTTVTSDVDVNCGNYDMLLRHTADRT